MIGRLSIHVYTLYTDTGRGIDCSYRSVAVSRFLSSIFSINRNLIRVDDERAFYASRGRHRRDKQRRNIHGGTVPMEEEEPD